MNKDEILEICSEIYDKIALIKKYINVETVDYPIYRDTILQELENIDKLVGNLVVKANQLSTNRDFTSGPWK